MLNNEELTTLKAVRDYLVQVKNPGTANSLDEIIKKYELVRTKLRSKIIISKEDLLEMRLKGLSTKQIAKKCKCGTTTITQLLVLYGLKGVGGARKEKEDEKVTS